MCGLVGVAGSLTAEHDKVFKQLLIVDSLRGTDSTGMCLVPRDGGDELVVKGVGNPFDFMDSAQFTKAFQRFASVIMGHNRFATQGKVNKTNAHPFEFDSLIGMHNGTLIGKHNLLDHMQFAVDSENLYWHIDQLGLRSAMDEIQGAWSLVWWDKHEATLNFLRNDERPMHMAHINHGKTLAWASEKKMLELVLERNGVENPVYHETEINLHYKFYFDNKGALSKPTITRMAPKKENPKPHAYGNFPSQGASTNTQGASATSTVVALVPTSKPVEISKTEKKSIASQIQRGYVSSKGIKLELVDYGIDEHGQRFVHCFDEAHPYLQIRLYVKKNMEYADEIAEGDRYIRCDIKEVNIKNPKDIYYKVAVNSVAILPVDPKPLVVTTDVPPFETEETDTSVETMFKDHRGRYRDADDWNMEYGTCACCTGYVDPMRPHKFAMNGEALCYVCVADKQIMASINVM